MQMRVCELIHRCCLKDNNPAICCRCTNYHSILLARISGKIKPEALKHVTTAHYIRDFIHRSLAVTVEYR